MCVENHFSFKKFSEPQTFPATFRNLEELIYASMNKLVDEKRSLNFSFVENFHVYEKAAGLCIVYI